MTHVGSCFCGAVEVEVTGEPAAMGYCHCRSCRSWSGGPVNAFSLWKPAAVRVTRGAEHVATFSKTPLSERQYCAKCGGHLMNRHPPIGLVDVYAATVPTSTTRPVGIWKKSVASLAVLASEMKSLSCQRGMPDCAAARIERRDRKNDVAMMSNLKPSLRRIARPRGMFGVSM